jgi:peptidyl-prolyl cis-trans isomerase A (cyclophilin A)
MDGSAPHIDSSYTIFGDCTPLEVIHDIANQPTHGDRPLSPVLIESVTIRRSG